MSNYKEFAQLNQLRAQIYRMLGSLYFTELTDEQIRILAEQDYEAFADLDPELACGAKEMERAFRHVNSATREEFAVDYAHTFLAAGASKNEKRAVPFESVYTSESGMLMGPARQGVYKMMLREGVLPDVRLRVPEDHVSFEFEFMAVMADRAVAACTQGNAVEAQRCVQIQHEFMREHLCVWMDVFTKAIERTCRTRLYKGIALMTRAFVCFDRELLDECDELLGVCDDAQAAVA